MEQTKKLLSDAVVQIALAAQNIKAHGAGLSENQRDALNALNDVICIIEDEVIPALEGESHE